MLEDGTRDSSAAADEQTWLPPLKDLMSTSGHCNDLLVEGHMMAANALADPEPYRLLLAYATLPPRRCSVPAPFVLQTHQHHSAA